MLIKSISRDQNLFEQHPHLSFVDWIDKLLDKEGRDFVERLLTFIFYVFDVKSDFFNSPMSESDKIKSLEKTLDFKWDEKFEKYKDKFLAQNLSRVEKELFDMNERLVKWKQLLQDEEPSLDNAHKLVKAEEHYQKLLDGYLNLEDKVKQETGRAENRGGYTESGSESETDMAEKLAKLKNAKRS